MQHQIDAVVKTFVNNASKTFFVRVYDGNNKMIALTLEPGDIEDVFIPSTSITKIVVIDAKHSSKMVSPVSRNELRNNMTAINSHNVFIINQNSSIKMYESSTRRDKMLNHINEAFMQKTELPSINLAIHTMQTDQPWATQKVTYNLKDKSSFVGSIESLFT